jgi:hypothetical protein
VLLPFFRIEPASAVFFLTDMLRAVVSCNSH